MARLSIHPDQARNSGLQMDNVEKVIREAILDMEKVQNGLDGEILAAVSRSLGAVIRNSGTHRQRLLSLKRSLDEIITLYEQTERMNLGALPDKGTLQDALANIRQKMDEILQNLTDYLNSLKGKDREGCSYGGDPINFSTGNFVLEKEYLKLQGHFPLSFRLFYNSLEKARRQVGTGWNHGFQMCVEKNGDKYVLHCGDGREETFFRTEQGTFRALLDSGRRMEANGDQIVTRDARGITCVFGPEGRIVEMKARHAGALSFIYDDHGELVKVRSTSGEELRFACELRGAAGQTGAEADAQLPAEPAAEAAAKLSTKQPAKLLRVSDHTGRSVELSYEGEYLTGITDELGNRTAFKYDGNGFLSAVLNAAGTEILRNEYEGTGRVLRQHFPGGGAMELDYGRKQNELHVTEQNGNQITYVMDEMYRNVETVYENGKTRTAYDHRNRKTSFVDKKGNTTRYAYDQAGRLSRITNPLGEEMSFTFHEDGQVRQILLCGEVLWSNTYDDKGNLTERSDALGRTSRFLYNAYGKPVKIIQPDESEIRLEYDEKGNITKIRAPFGGTTCYEYDGYGNVTASTDGNGNRTEYSYNGRGFLTRVKNAEGNVREYTYNAAGKVAGIRDFDGSVLKREYNDAGMLTKAVDQTGRTTEYAYDSMFHVISRREANGAEFHFEYDRLNRLTGIINPFGGHVTYEYDENDNQTRVIDDQGGEIRCEYDPLDRLVAVTDADGSITRTQYNSMGQPVMVTDAAGHVRREEYDAAGQKIRTIDVTGNETVYTYDRLGNMTGFTDAAGRRTVFTYLPGGLLKKAINPDGTFFEYEYDRNRNVIRRTDQNGYFIAYEYDCMNRVTAVSDPEGVKKRFRYNALGQVSEETDGNGGITRYSYTAAGKLSGVTDPLGNRTSYSYDCMGFMTDVWQEDGQTETPAGCRELKEVLAVNAGNEKRHLAHYERNCMGQLTKAEDALGNAEHYAYDLNGRLTERVDPEGNRFTYTYTAGGMLQRILCADGKSVELSYNPLKQLIGIKDWLGITTIENDPAGRPVRIQDPAGRETVYQRGVLGEREMLLYPGGKRITYGYDELRRLVSMESDEGQYGFAYDENGRLSRKSLPNGLVTEYAYGPSGRLQVMESRDGKGILDRFTYAYDPEGNTTGIGRERRNLPGESGQYRYTYDACGRLTGVSRNGEVLETYGYDGFGNRSFAVNGAERTEYDYDRANRMIRSVTGNRVTDYRYDPRGNLLEITENRAENHTEMSGSRKLFRYDAFNRMCTCVGEERSALYEYNGLGHRVRASCFDTASLPPGTFPEETVVPSETKEYLYDLTGTFGNLLEEKCGNRSTAYVWSGSLGAAIADGAARYYLHDAAGSPLRKADDAGNILESFAFDAFGNSMLKTGGQAENLPAYGFAGYFSDPTAGMYLTKQRGYLPSAGRFASKDVLSALRESPCTLNDYVYCWNRPLDFADCDGAFPTWNDVGNFVRHTADTVKGGVEEAWNTGVGYVRDGTKKVFNTANRLYEEYVPKEVQNYISAGGTLVLNTGRSLIEVELIGGYSISDQLAWLSQTPPGAAFLDMVSFSRTSDGVYYAKQDCWQEPFGYNDFYDFVFNGTTSCDRQKFTFISDGTVYTIWMWKGDYLNLGAGCETGIYYSEPGSYHMYSATDTGITQTISLRDKEKGEVIFEYDPGSPHWWITGFNPRYQDKKAENLAVNGSICFAANPELWEAFYEAARGREGWCFNEETKTAYYEW